MSTIQKLLYMLLCFIVISFIVQRNVNRLSLVYLVIAFSVYTVFVVNDKPMKRELFTAIETDTEGFANILFEEPILKDKDHLLRCENRLVVYVSSFNKTMIDLTKTSSGMNTMYNIINRGIGALSSEELKTGFHQLTGVNISKQITLPTPRELFTDTLHFSLVFNIKLMNITGDASFFKFDAENTIGFKLFEIKFVNSTTNRNPNIEVWWCGTKSITYSYTDAHLDEGKLFNDNENHTFVFVKDFGYDGLISIYMDGILLETDSVEETGNLRVGDSEIKLSGDNHYVLMNSGGKMRYYLAAMGIYDRKSLTLEEAKDWSNYFKSIHTRLNPGCKILEWEILDEKIKSLNGEYCKVNDPEICDDKCNKVDNWNNLENLKKYKNCFKSLVNYCDSLSNIPHSDDVEANFCTFLKSQGIFDSAIILDSNLLYYKKGTDAKEELTNEELLADLKQLGLTDVFIDKTFRSDNAGYSSEMRKILGDLMKTNQTATLETVSDLTPELKSSNGENSEIDQLLSRLKASDTNDRTDNTNSSRNTGSDLIDLDINESSRSDSYKHIIDQYNLEKNKSSDSGIFGSMMGWFT